LAKLNFPFCVFYALVYCTYPQALKKKEKAEQELQKVEVYMQPIERPVDIETITEEERFMYRRLGIRMKSTLLLG
jgi:hypothetical protein